MEKVSRSITFSRAEQLRRLLKWLGSRSAVESGEAPSEKEIAVEVLGRKEFDPQTDSLVRKEMSRLREKLTRYYATEGLNDDIRIDSLSGYLFGFKRNENALSTGGRPCWLVLPFRSGPDLEEQALELIEELMAGLSEGGRVELIAPTTALGYDGRTGDVRKFAAECHASLVVEGSLRRLGDSLAAAAWLVDGQSGRVVRFKRFTASSSALLAAGAVAWLLGEDPYQRSPPQDTQGT